MNTASTDSARLAALRDVLTAPTDHATAWARLCDLFTAWLDAPDPLDVALDYALQHLAAWPAHVPRVAPRPWIARSVFTGVAPPPPIALANTLDLSNDPYQPLHTDQPADPILADCLDTPFGHLRHLRGLSLRHVDLTYDGLAKLSPHIHNMGISWLDLSGALLTPPDAAHLAESPNFSNIESLTLRGASLPPDGLLALTRSPHLTRLTRLDLTGVPLAPPIADALAAGTLARQVTHLSLRRTGLTAPALNALLSALPPNQLLALDLAENPLGDGATAAVAASATALRHLDLSNCALTDASAATLAAAHNVAHLTTLSLSDNPFGDTGARHLAAAPHLTRRLERLALSHCGVGDAGGRALLASLDSPALRALDLSSTPQRRRRGVTGQPLPPNLLGDRSVEALLQADLLALEGLNVRYNAVGERGLLALARGPRLAWMYVCGHAISDPVAAAFREAYPTAPLREIQRGRITTGAASDSPPFWS